MSIHHLGLSHTLALTLASIFTLVPPVFAEPNEIALPGERAYPESITAAPDGTLYVSSPAIGGVWRIKPQTGSVEEWLKPGAFGTRSTLGVLADTNANFLWVCSNDFSSSGIPGPSSVPGSFVKGFDLASGEGKVSAQLPGNATLCNDMVVGPDGSLFVTNSLAPQILELRPGSNQLEVWLESGGDGSLKSITDIIRNGVPQPKQHPGAMPPFGGVQMSESDLAALAAYVWAIGHQTKG